MHVCLCSCARNCVCVYESVSKTKKNIANQVWVVLLLPQLSQSSHTYIYSPVNTHINKTKLLLNGCVIFDFRLRVRMMALPPPCTRRSQPERTHAPRLSARKTIGDVCAKCARAHRSDSDSECTLCVMYARFMVALQCLELGARWRPHQKRIVLRYMKGTTEEHGRTGRARTQRCAKTSSQR